MSVQLKNLIQQIKNAVLPSENTAVRVGSTLELLDSEKANIVDTYNKSEVLDMINEVKLLATSGAEFLGTITPASTIPSDGDLWAFAGEGTYSNAGGLIVGANNLAVLSRVNNIWSKLEIVIPAPENKLISWIAGSYIEGTQRINPNDNSVYQANSDVISTDVPGISDKWDKVIGGDSDAIRYTFTQIIKFDEKRKFSTVNQAGNIDFVFDGSGLEKNAVIKAEIISDGVGDINFSSDFEVIGSIDKTKNQVIYFTRESVVEFKTAAIIMNIAKSGQITPIELDPDAQIYYDRLLAAGATLTTSEINAMNNLYLSAKSKGYYNKLKGLYLVLGNTQSARLVNGIAGRVDATLSSGTVTNDGIVGVLDSGMKPSDIFTLSSFSYGIHNTTPIYSNLASIGCGVSSTSGILLICTATSPSGQFLFSGPNKDVYANAAMADSLGTFVVTRTEAALAKLFKNGSLYFTHTASQGAATLPNINFAIGGYNDNGVFSDDGRTSKWAFIGDGLTDVEAENITTDLSNLMTAIGR